MATTIPIPPMMTTSANGNGTCGGGPQLCFHTLGNVQAASGTKPDGGRVLNAELDRARTAYFNALQEWALKLRSSWEKASAEVVPKFVKAFPEEAAAAKARGDTIELTLALSGDLEKVTLIGAVEPKDYMAKLKAANARAAAGADVKVKGL